MFYKLSSFGLVCFDLDGTLIDSRSDIAASTNRMLFALGLPQKTDTVIAGYVGSGVANLIRQSLGDRHENLFDRALSFFKHDYDAHCLDKTRLFPGVAETLKRLPMPKAVLTNKPLRFSEKILEGLGVRNFFESVLGGDMQFPKKPAPDAIHFLASQHTGLAYQDMLIVGDSRVDMETGKNAGIQTCA
ncbi:MAG: HAD hydrolase-like protein, partial [Candidatus Omnitrophica bacterium]|nr:HAD hydrolase-like protein [Candidatus Omnitrophota bacterium]